MADEKKKYIPKDNSGNDYAQLAGMSQLHQAALAAAGQAWNQAQAAGDQAGMDQAHQRAEAIRSLYGYSGGRDGSEYIPAAAKADGQSGDADRKSGAAGFSYASAPAYVSRYQDQINGLTQQILGRPAFEYDPEKDSAYQQYRESYTRAGQRAMEDTLGQLAARTGGLASSYAGSMAQQTYDSYMSALADKIPELRQLAYDMYQQEGERQRSDLAMLTALEQGDYARYQGLLDQYSTDRSFAYGVHRDGISDARYDTQWEYQVGRDQLDDQRYDTQWDYQVGRDQLADQRYDQQTAWQRQQAALAGSAAASAGSGSGGTQSEAGVYQQLYQAGVRSYDDAYEMLRAAGYSATDANRYARGLVNKLEAGDFAAPAMDLSAIDSGTGDLYGDIFGRTPGSLSSSRRNQLLTQADALYRPAQAGRAGLTSLDWDQDEGIFQWNGKRYPSVERLLEEIDQAGLTQEELNALQRRFQTFGMSLTMT